VKLYIFLIYTIGGSHSGSFEEFSLEGYNVVSADHTASYVYPRRKNSSVLQTAVGLLAGRISL
jgi:hypothetical protein